ncbi:MULTISPECIES: exodeoxyribonuclease III [unclassified Rhodococcus (in: high G+C Gram-positive bacteria)]|uniref:exodeoxyribonuclease III n=1 Tax=unclassified Rhodococcus (in: high G+C Gram-positive bacteria) TaxID=192944 RepID=UPI0009EB01E2|nr:MULTISPECIES: exodeoxyribonuclease III [unclassified Rhodococcus (in: high G+C Gram-positive bacteria)]
MSHTITSVNVNGIRAAVRKGMLDWLATSGADVICLQETRATDDEVLSCLGPALDGGRQGAGWHLVSAEPSVKGRNGVAILSRTPAESIRIGFGDAEFDESGRYIEARYPAVGADPAVTVASLYLPSGEVGTEKQASKERFMAAFAHHLDASGSSGEHHVVCGDWNIAHTELDLKNWKGNRTKSGFLPSERAWLDSFIGETGAWTDVVRALHPDQDGPYSWWSYRGKAFDNDAGWRIDYQMATTDYADRAKDAVVERADSYDLRWSDHAPVTVVYR